MDKCPSYLTPKVGRLWGYSSYSASVPVWLRSGCTLFSHIHGLLPFFKLLPYYAPGASWDHLPNKLCAWPCLLICFQRGSRQQCSYNPFPASGCSWLDPNWQGIWLGQLCSISRILIETERMLVSVCRKLGLSHVNSEALRGSQCITCVQVQRASLWGGVDGRRAEEENGQENQRWETASCSRLPPFLKFSCICFLVCELGQYRYSK